MDYQRAQESIQNKTIYKKKIKLVFHGMNKPHPQTLYMCHIAPISSIFIIIFLVNATFDSNASKEQKKN